MSKTCEEYVERMGNMPSYRVPEKIDEDEEFEYFKIRVPRQYIKEHIEMGETWPHAVDTSIKGERDESVVLGVIFVPVYAGVEYLEEDVDFLYYKARVPKVFLDAPILNSKFTYRLLYEKGDKRLETAGQRAERKLDEKVQDKAPIAGAPMVGKEELMVVRKVKETEALLYEVTFVCNEADCGAKFEEVGSDLFGLLYGRCCGKCANTKMTVESCKVIAEEK